MNKFHHLGTKHETYIKRFNEKYNGIKSFSFNKVDDNYIAILDEKLKKIDIFTSKATFNQFIMVLESFEIIKPIASGYGIKNNLPDWEYMFEAIFSNSSDKHIQVYRESRKISFLYLLNLVDENFIKKNGISKIKGSLEPSDINKEVSLWEKEGIKSYDRIIKFLERVKHEYKI